MEKLFVDSEKYSGPWNFGPNKRNVKTVSDTIDLAANFWGNNANWDYSKEEYPKEAKFLRLNSAKAHSQLGWKQQLTFDQTIVKTMHWYKEYYSKLVDMKELTLNQIKDYISIFNE